MDFFGLADEFQNLRMKDIPTFFQIRKKQKVGAGRQFLTENTKSKEGKIHRLAQMNTDFSDLPVNLKTTDYTDFRFARIFFD